MKLPAGDHKAGIYTNNLKWKEPTSSPGGQGVDFTCPTGFVAEGLQGTTEHFVCSKGLYNGTYSLPDLLCRSDFHKNIQVLKIPAQNLNSKVLHCNTQGWAVYEVSRKDPSGEKALYRVCLDTNTMRPKFSFRLASPEKLVVRRSSREDVWGFDGYGKTAEDRMRLSQGYVKNVQKRRITQAYPNKYDKDNTYPYYFNRGHLVAHADFLDHEDQKTTVEYVNAAPQWDVLNEHSWSLVEIEARSMIQNSPADWEIYTGTYGRLQTPRGVLFLAPVFDKTGRFVKGQLPVPLVFWKLVYNTKDNNQSRVFLGVNNPEIRTVADLGPLYRLCNLPIRRDGKLVHGDEYKGFTYECPVQEFLLKLEAEEKVVK